MADTGRRTWIAEWAPWLISLLLLGALVVVLARSQRSHTDNFTNMVRQREIVAAMRTSLFESIHAEKSALISESESDSKSSAAQAQEAADALSRGRKELDALLGSPEVAGEKELLTELDSFWQEFREIQRKILDLDIAGTNIKALALSADKGQVLVKQFEESLTKVGRAAANTERCGEVTKLTYQAIIALMKIESIQTPHIHAVTDEEMDRIEKIMREQDSIVQNALATLGEILGPASREGLDEATRIYVDFAALTDEVIKLSRSNTNVRSLELAMGRERVVAAKCNEILEALQKALTEKGLKATR